MRKEEVISLIESKRDELIEKLEEAFCESIEYRHLKVNVELYEDGDIQLWVDSVNGNVTTFSSFVGSSVCIASFCNQYLEPDRYGELFITEEEWYEWYKEEYKNEEAEHRLAVFIESLE